MSEELYEVELVLSKIEKREQIIFGFFILQYAKLRMLELFYKFFDKFCHVESFEELETDIGYLYLALADYNLYGCTRPSKRAEWESLREHHCDDSFKADAVQNVLPRTCCGKHKKDDKREPGLFKEVFRCT